MRGASALATYIGRALVLIGLVLILLAWDKAARFDTLQEQFPYLLSASVPGMAMIIIGMGLEYLQNLRALTAKRAKQMAELNVAVLHLVSTIRTHGGLGAAPAEPAAVPVAVGATAGAAGTAVTQSFAAAPVATGPDGGSDQVVVAGRSSFHRLDCHLVSGRDDMAQLTRLEAEAQSLSACRVCKP
jgi:hypothetical protein